MSDDLIDKMRDAIAAVISEDDGAAEVAAGIITGFVLVTEHYGTDGQTWCSVWSGTEHSARSMGLLKWADVHMQLREADDE